MNQPTVLQVLVDDLQQDGLRLDQFVAERLDDVSRTRAHDLIRDGYVRVSGRAVRPSYRVQAGDDIAVELPPPTPSELIPEQMPLEVRYEDDDMVVLDKRAGIAVHPAPGHAEHTLVHGLLARYPDLPGIGGTQRPGIVHRLDLDTSGLMMVAKTLRGMASLAAQLEARKVRKGYIALLKGKVEKTSGIIDAPIARDPIHRQRMAIVAGGRQARTRYQQLDSWDDATLVLAQPETGRTHQIRVHFTALGAPVAGDATYGGMVDYLDRQFLHAAFLRFARPCDSETVEVDSPLPADLRGALGAILRSHGTPAIEIDRSIAQMLALAKRHYCKSS